MSLSLKKEKVADNVYYFQSDSYALVTAGVVVGPQWAVLIDTLSNLEETQAVAEYIEEELGAKVRYVVNTHYHADHCWGNCVFPEATVIAHQLCRDLLEQRGKPALEETRKQNSLYKRSRIILPHITFQHETLCIQVGKKRLNLISMPGHSADSIGVFIEEDRVLFAGDAFMEMPFIVDGDVSELIQTLDTISNLGLENIVQGHGDIILRGEIDAAIRENLNYLTEIQVVIGKAHKRVYPGDYLLDTSVVQCGKDRVLLGGLAEDLHQRNLRALYRQVYGVLPDYEEFDED